MKKFLAISIFLILIFPVFHSFADDSKTVPATLQADTTCGNGICDTALGENADTCAMDCAAITPTPIPTPTPAVIPIVTPTPGGAVIVYDIKPPLIYGLSIKNITFNSADISWKTNEQAFCAVYWGRTDEYREESIIGVVYSLNHSADLKNLLPATVYHFKIACWDLSKNKAETSDQQFITLIPADIISPSNVLNFEALPGDSQVLLKWKNPADADFEGVRIVKSKSFYIFNPWEGTLVYNGAENLYIDKGLENGTKYYYTAFAYDRAGNYSSGSIASATPNKIIPSAPSLPVFPTPVPTLAPEIIKITFEDFDFFQEGKKLGIVNSNTVYAKANIPITASISYEKIKAPVEKIIINISRGGKTSSYIFSKNNNDSAYEAVFNVSEAGDYALRIDLLNYKNEILQSLPGILIVEGIKGCGILAPFAYQLMLIDFLLILFALLLIILIIQAIRIILKAGNNNE